MKFRLFLLFLGVIFFTTSIFAQITLFKDINIINSTTSSSNPNSFATLGSEVIFVAEKENLGIELWKSDGTSNGTVLLKDISPNASSFPKELTTYNGHVYFSENTFGVGGTLLWKTDGTPNGTQPITNLTSSIAARDFIVYNGFLYFTAYLPVSGNYPNLELWKTDGTPAGTTMIKNLVTGTSVPAAERLTVSNGLLYISAGASSMFKNLWVSDGTTVGTIQLGTIFGTEIASVGSNLFFVGNASNSGVELWKTDGTILGTQMVKDINLGASGSSNPGSLCAHNGEVYFSADNGSLGIELWKSDGTATGTILVKDIYSSGNQSSSPSNIISDGISIYFSATDATNGNELWKSDGTTAGTVLLKNINPGTSSSNPANFKISNNQIFFSATNSSSGNELYKTDGTATGTVLVKDISPGTSNSSPVNLYDFNGELIFSAQNGVNNFELWKSDGTSTGTQQVKNIFSDAGSSNVKKLTNFNNKTIFSANNGSVVEGMWSSDGTPSGTNYITLLGDGTSGGFETRAVQLGNSLIYAAGSSSSARELFITDGTPSGSVLLKSIAPGIGSNPAYLTKSGNYVFFTAWTSSTGRELWRTDGTLVGTVLVKNIGLGSNDGYINNLIDFNGTLYFSASYGAQQMWKSDGTTAGTVAVTNYSGTTSEFSNFYIHNNELYFEYKSISQNNSIRKVNASGNGTITIKTLPSSTNGSGISIMGDFISNNGILYFTTVYPMGGYYLWRSDGTTAGTYGITVSLNGSNCSSATNLTSYLGNIYFASNSDLYGNELWKSDGTQAGTQLLLDILSGPGSGDPQAFKVNNGTLYFTANNGIDGYEFWKSNGSASTTYMFDQIETDFNSSQPTFIENFNNKLIFSAYSSATGRELFYYVDLQNTDTVVCDSYLWPQTGIIYNSTGVYADTLIGISGVDSILTLNLTVNSNSGIDTQIACDSFIWIDGNTYSTSNNSASHVLTNVMGCDSTVTLDLTILYSNSSTDLQIACDSFIWIDGNTYFSSNNSATYTLTNAVGCDSIISLNLTIFNSSISVDAIMACDSLVWQDGITYFTSNNSALWSLANSAGCDSIIQLDLTIQNSTQTTDVQFACNTYTWIDGLTYTTSNNSAFHTLSGTTGCDSIINLDLTVIPSAPITINTFSLPDDTSSCIGQVAITTSGNGPFILDINNSSILENSNGFLIVDSLCHNYYDLLVTDYCGDTLSQIIVIPVDTNYVFNNLYLNTIAVDSLGTTIQNCTIYYNSIDTAYIDSLFMTGNTVNIIWNIIDSTGNNYDTTTFVPNNGNGVYWVQLSVFCPQEFETGYFTVTEAIYFINGNVSNVGLNEHGFSNIKVYPNPFEDNFTIESDISLESVNVYDATGRLVFNQNLDNKTAVISLEGKQRGVYFVQINSNYGSIMKQLIKQ